MSFDLILMKMSNFLVAPAVGRQCFDDLRSNWSQNAPVFIFKLKTKWCCGESLGNAFLKWHI